VLSFSQSKEKWILVYLLCTIKQYYTALAIPNQKIKKERKKKSTSRKEKINEPGF